MTARKTLPIGIIIMTLVFALAALGVGYAWWTEQLTASGSIQTGSIDVKIENVELGEDDPLKVGECNFKLSDGGKGIRIQIKNAYPGYRCRPKFSLNNYGSVPAKVTGVTITNSSGGVGLIPGGALADRSMLNPSVPKAADFNIQITQEAGQRGSYEFSVSIDVTQGNAP